MELYSMILILQGTCLANFQRASASPSESLKSLKIIYNCESICRSLQDLSVCIGSDEGIKEISMLRNIQNLNISNSLITDDAMSEIGIMTSITSLKILVLVKILEMIMDYFIFRNYQI
jgi:hypothetical protein